MPRKAPTAKQLAARRHNSLFGCCGMATQNVKAILNSPTTCEVTKLAAKRALRQLELIGEYLQITRIDPPESK